MLKVICVVVRLLDFVIVSKHLYACVHDLSAVNNVI